MNVSIEYWGYPASVVEGVGRYFIKVRENLISKLAFGVERGQDYSTLVSEPRFN
jgi:hypothetical protein